MLVSGIERRARKSGKRRETRRGGGREVERRTVCAAEVIALGEGGWACSGEGGEESDEDKTCHCD